MFSIVCPTMWKGKEFRELYPKLLPSKEIGEILIINNDSANTPSWFQNHPKMRVLDFGRNTFVNPAWNIGVKESKYDQICLLSDDLNFHPDLFRQLLPNVISRVGILGMNGSNLHSNLKVLTSRKIFFEFIPKTIPEDLIFGCLMFFHKENYKPIPEEFKIYFGVEYLCAHTTQNLNKRNYYIKNMELQTNWGSTSHSSIFKDQTLEEFLKKDEIFERDFPKSYKPKIKLTEEEFKKLLKNQGTLLQERVNAITNSDR